MKKPKYLLQFICPKCKQFWSVQSDRDSALFKYISSFYLRESVMCAVDHKNKEMEKIFYDFSNKDFYFP